MIKIFLLTCGYKFKFIKKGKQKAKRDKSSRLKGESSKLKARHKVSGSRCQINELMADSS